MPERVEWRDDASIAGTPYSPRFRDRYRSESGGLEQAKDVFLAGCGLPAAWASKPQWCVLETGFGLGLNFLVTWLAWKTDPLRPRMLHFISTEAYPTSAGDILRGASAHPSLFPLAMQLTAQLYGLLPGFHRFAFEDGHVLLTLCIGDAKAMLRQQQFRADSVYLDGFSPAKNPEIWDVHTLKAVARCCTRGSRVATWTVSRQVRNALAEAGFVIRKTPGTPPKRDNLQGEYNPAWEPKRPSHTAVLSLPRQASSCIVIGAGLAGAAAAASLARRGWQVLVLDTANTPASGASALPAGLLAPHFSPDDSPLSRLSRSGVRMTLQQAMLLLQPDRDWGLTGVLQHRLVDESGNGNASIRKDPQPLRQPDSWQGFESAGDDWVTAATTDQLAKAGLCAPAQALHFPQAGWMKPASFVKTWLKTPGITWTGGTKVERLASCSRGWQALDDQGRVVGQACLVVIASAIDSARLSDGLALGGGDQAKNTARLALQPIRGQVSWGLHAQTHTQTAHDTVRTAPLFSAPLPINGHGSLIPEVPSDGGLAWFTGATYEREAMKPGTTISDHQANFRRLQVLHPEAAAQLAKAFANNKISGWSGVRCATPGRLPVLGCIAANATGEIWASTGMGSRGLTFAALCGELLAAELHEEPLPVELSLANSLKPAPKSR